jgi:dUTPase
VDLKVKVLEGGKLPLQATKDAACFDFYARKIERVENNKVIVYLGVAFDMSEGQKIVIQPRSSFTFSGWVMANSPAQIDEDYKLEVQMRIIAIPNGVNTFIGASLTYPEIPFKEGERVCQGYLTFKTPVDLIEVENIEDNGRGGFGHTGK